MTDARSLSANDSQNSTFEIRPSTFCLSSMLDQETRQALEFNALLQLAATLAQTPLGARRIQSWEPLTAVEQIQCLQRRTSEAKQWVQKLRPTFEGLDDPASLLAGLAVEDLSLEPAQILLAARYLGK